jgi:hypothetical protein
MALVLLLVGDIPRRPAALLQQFAADRNTRRQWYRLFKGAPALLLIAIVILVVRQAVLARPACEVKPPDYRAWTGTQSHARASCITIGCNDCLKEISMHVAKYSLPRRLAATC